MTEERRATGIFGILNIRENTTISSLKKYQTGPFLNKKKMKDTTDEYIKSLRVKTPNQETKSARFQAVISKRLSLQGGF